MYVPSKKEFLKLTKKGNLVPVYKEIFGDLETPVSAYFKIAEKSKYSFLLESVEGEEKVARFSFLARDPELIIQTKGNKATITRFKNGKAVKENHTIEKTPLELIKNVMKRYSFVNLPELPRFCGGLIGYLSYDVVKFLKSCLIRLRMI